MQMGSRFIFCSILALAAVLPAVASPHVRRGPTAPRLSRPHPPRSANHSTLARGIDPDRANQIQTALIEAGYLSGTPTGTWDAASQGAMEKLQSNNGWQTKLVPDSRAIIKLGLGPKSTAERPEAATSVVSDAPLRPSVQ